MLVEKELNWLAEHNITQAENISQFSNALTNDVFVIDSAQQRVIFKRLNQKARSREDRHAEFAVQQLAAQSGLTSAVIAHSDAYKLQCYIAGEILDENCANLLPLLAQQLLRVHQLPALHAPKQRLVFELKQLKQQLTQKFKQHIKPSIDDTRFAQMLTLAKQLDERSDCATLCHGDLSINNVLRGDDAQHYILDWEYAVLACPAYDLAFCAAINGFDQVKMQQLVDSYQLQCDVIDRQVVDSLQKECQLYFNIFSYINELWSICFLDNN